MSKSKKWEKWGLLKLASILELAATTVERAFSPMKGAKSRRCNWLCDPLLNECLVFLYRKKMYSTHFPMILSCIDSKTWKIEKDDCNSRLVQYFINGLNFFYITHCDECSLVDTGHFWLESVDPPLAVAHGIFS